MWCISVKILYTENEIGTSFDYILKHEHYVSLIGEESRYGVRSDGRYGLHAKMQDIPRTIYSYHKLVLFIHSPVPVPILYSYH